MTVIQLSETLGAKPFEIIADMLDLGYFVSLSLEIRDECLLDYAKSREFEFRIVNRL